MKTSPMALRPPFTALKLLNLAASFSTKSASYPVQLKYHVNDNKAAELIASSIQKNSQDPHSPLLEVSPGPGLLTRSLLEQDVPKIVLLEERQEYVDVLKDLAAERGSSLEIENKISFMHLLKTPESQLLKDVFKNIDTEKQNMPVGRVFAVFGPNEVKWFISPLMRNISSQWSTYARTNLENFFVVPPSLFTEMTTPSYGNTGTRYTKWSVLAQTFFKVLFICKIPNTCFQPVIPLPKAKYFQKIDPGFSYLIKLVSNPDLENTIGSADLWNDFYYFVHLNMKVSTLIIPTLEKWIPGCGPTLIKNGYYMFTSFKDLSPSDILKLFKVFSSLDDYPDSNFKNAFSKDLEND